MMTQQARPSHKIMGHQQSHDQLEAVPAPMRVIDFDGALTLSGGHPTTPVYLRGLTSAGLWILAVDNSGRCGQLGRVLSGNGKGCAFRGFLAGRQVGCSATADGETPKVCPRSDG